MARVKNCLYRTMSRSDKQETGDKTPSKAGRLLSLHVRMRGNLVMSRFTFESAPGVVKISDFFVIGSETAKQESKPALLDSYELNSSVDSSGSKSHESLVDVDCEIPTSQSIDIFDRRMVKTKQMAHKGADFNEDRNASKQPQQGIPATFPHKGKLTGKAVSHMATYNEDEGES